MPQNRLERLREAKGWNRKELAAVLGVHPRTVYRWETGESRIPEKHLGALTDLFGVSVGYLLGFDGERS